MVILGVLTVLGFDSLAVTFLSLLGDPGFPES